MSTNDAADVWRARPGWQGSKRTRVVGLAGPLKVSSSSEAGNASGKGRSTEVPSHRPASRRPAARRHLPVNNLDSPTSRCCLCFALDSEPRPAYRLAISPRYRLYRTSTAPAHVSHTPTNNHVCPPAADGPTRRCPLRSVQARPLGYACAPSRHAYKPYADPALTGESAVGKVRNHSGIEPTSHSPSNT